MPKKISLIKLPARPRGYITRVVSAKKKQFKDAYKRKK